MKRKLASSVMLIGLLALCLISAGCQTTPSSQSSQSGAQMVITLTDIPAAYSGMVGMLTLSPPGSQRGSSIAWALGNIGANNVFIGSMLDWEKDQPWFRSGTYFVTLLIDETMDALAERGRDPKYTGVIYSKSITEETVSISFNELLAQ